MNSSIIISGAAVATSLGLDLDSTWREVCAGRCGVGPSTALEQTPRVDCGVGQAPNLPADFLPEAPREVRYLRHVLDTALVDAGIDSTHLKSRRVGTVIGTTLHGMRAAGDFFRSDNPAPLQKFQAATVLASAFGAQVTRHGAITVCTACASGISSILIAADMLRRGELDLVIAGGYDTISEYAYAGFNSLRLVATGPQRPFARDRAGMKLAEGYALVVLEREEDAIDRGVSIFARLCGGGDSADAHHLSQPQPEGRGAARAITLALDQASIPCEQVDLIAAHATATPDNDGAEFRALQRVFGDHLAKMKVTAFKSHLGHSLGAAGAVELILACQAMRERAVPPVANVAAADIEFETLPVVTGDVAEGSIRHGAVMSLGFGGSNACAIVAPSDAPHSHAAIADHTEEVVISGIGVVLPDALDHEAFVQQMRGNESRTLSEDVGAIDAVTLEAMIDVKRSRRLSQYVKLALAASRCALAHSGIEGIDRMADRCGAILGTTHGAANFSGDYYHQIVDEGLEAANPLLFAEGVPNAGAAHVSMMLGLHGACQSVIGSRTAGLDAIRLAAARITSGAWDVAIVNAAEEFSTLINRVYAHCGLHGLAGGLHNEGSTGFFCGDASVTLILESRKSVDERGGRVLATLDGALQRCWDVNDLSGAVDAVSDGLAQLGETDAVGFSANGTWIDRVEAMACRKVFGRSIRPTSVYGHVAESFSAMPLLALASWLSQPTSTDAVNHRFTSIVSDYNGVSTAARWIRT